jgi:hypothetical protein
MARAILERVSRIRLGWIRLEFVLLTGVLILAS